MMMLCLNSENARRPEMARVEKAPVNFEQWMDQQWSSRKAKGPPCYKRLLKGRVHPFEPFERKWDLLMFLLVLYSAVADPYRASFMDLTPHWWDWCVDGFFYIDIVLCFQTGMVSRDASEVNFERRAVIRNYLTSWFAIDVIATFPFDTIIGATTDTRDSILRLLRMLRILRLLRAPRLIQRLTAHRGWAIDTGIIDFAKFSFYVLVVAHELACIFFLLPSVFETSCAPATVVAYLDGDLNGQCTPMGSWRENFILPPITDGDYVPAFTQFVWALYWAFSTITTIGYGDVTPVLVEEILFNILAETIGILIFAVLVDKVVLLSDVLDQDRLTNKKKNDMVQFMKTSDGFDDDFRQRILEYMTFRTGSSSLGAAASFDENHKRFNDLSPTLLAEMRCRIFRPILRKVSIFGATVRLATL
jgi:hypothetical protein